MASRDGRQRRSGRPGPAPRVVPRITARGVGLVVAAVALVLLGLALGRREAVAVGVFVAVAVAASAAVVAVQILRGRRLRVRRTVTPGEVTVGGSVDVDLDPPLPGLVDGTPGRSTVAATEHGYRWRPPQRGSFLLGPALLSLRSPFGLWTADAPLAGTTPVPVLPEPLEDEDLDRVLRAGIGERDTADLLGSRAAPDDLLVREHRDGDSLTRVHWGATARTGRLMMRQEEWAQDPWAVVVLDCRAASYPSGRYEVDGGAGTGWRTSPRFEQSVRAAAALVLRLQLAGHQVLLMDQHGTSVDPGLASAVLGPSTREATWPASLPADAASVVMLSGAAVGRDLPVLATVPHRLQRVAVLFGPAGPENAAGRLAAEGWLVAETGR